MNHGTFAALGIAAFIASCSSGQQVGGHTFDVPEEHQVNFDLPWLPQPDAESLLFILDPKRELRDTVSVAVELKSQVCNDETAFEKPVCSQSPLLSSNQWNDPPKLRRRGDAIDRGTQWQYVADGPGEEIVVAACFGPVNDGVGLCSSAVRYGDDLFVRIGYPETRLAELPLLITETQRLLASWER